MRAETTAQAVRDRGGCAIGVDVAERTTLFVAADAAAAFGGGNMLCTSVGVQQFGAAGRLTEAT